MSDKGGQAGGVGRPKNSLDTDGVPKLSDRGDGEPLTDHPRARGAAFSGRPFWPP